MKKLTRIKKINGHEYIYEVTYFYDKKTKRTKQKSKYLGKNVDGKPVRIREQAKHPQKAYDLGAFLPYLSVIDDMQLGDLLEEDLTVQESRMVIVIALAGLMNPDAMYNIGSWYNGTILSRYYPLLHLTTAGITRLLKKIGESDISRRFCTRFVNNLEVTDAFLSDIALDITNNLHHGTIDLLNGNGSGQPKNRISLVVDKEEGVPVMYLQRTDPITDTQTIKKQLTEISGVGIENVTLVMDGSFFSTMNFYDLIFGATPFIVPVSTRSSIVSQVVEECSIDMMHPKKMVMYQNESLFVQPIILSSAQAPIKGYLYYYPQQGDTMQQRFSDDLARIIKKLDKLRVYAWMNPHETIREVAGDLEPFLSWEEKDGELRVKQKNKVISRHTKHFGKFVLLYAGKDFEWDECLARYREKSEDEQILSRLTKNIDIYPQTVNSEKIRQGVLFTSFLALLLRRKVNRILIQSGLANIYSYERLFLELESIRLIELANQKSMVSALTGKQKEILSTLKISPDIV
ncbi:MAG: hypothetical protein JXA44_10670 [Methanospirillaceae archaeon]|nr:hypothetical protein [Methanospirillaceae archaeon]